MTDIDLSANVLAVLYILNALAWGCVGAAFAFGIMDRARKRKTTPKHTHTNFHA